MKFIPKAKPVKIRIKSGGEEHFTLESLRENFSLSDVYELWKNGILGRWLDQRGAKSIIEKLNGIDQSADIYLKKNAQMFLSCFFEDSVVDNLLSNTPAENNVREGEESSDPLPPNLQRTRRNIINDLRHHQLGETPISELFQYMNETDNVDYSILVDKMVSADNDDLKSFFRSDKITDYKISYNGLANVIKILCTKNFDGDFLLDLYSIFKKKGFTTYSDICRDRIRELYNENRIQNNPGIYQFIIDDFLSNPSLFIKNYKTDLKNQDDFKKNLINFLIILSECYILDKVILRQFISYDFIYESRYLELIYGYLKKQIYVADFLDKMREMLCGADSYNYKPIKDILSSSAANRRSYQITIKLPFTDYRGAILYVVEHLIEYSIFKSKFM